MTVHGDETPDASTPFSVLFVCTGNICRSPMAETVLRALADRAGIGEALTVASAGFEEYHAGDPADPRAVSALRRRGYNGSRHRSRPVELADLSRFDLIVALDRGHARRLARLATTEDERGRIRLLRTFESDALAGSALDVADPWYSDESVFDSTLVDIERACTAMLQILPPTSERVS